MVELHASFLEMRNLSVISSYKRFNRNSTAIWIFFFFSINFKREKFISERSFFSNLIINEAKDNCIILFEESRIRHPTFSHVCVLFSQLLYYTLNLTVYSFRTDALQEFIARLSEVYRGLSRNIARTGTFMVAVRFYSSILTQLASKLKKKEIAICPFLSSHFRNQRNDVSPEIFLPPTHKRIKSSLS